MTVRSPLVPPPLGARCPRAGGKPGLQAATPVFEAMARMLEGIGVGFCLFDEEDRTQLWNASFIAFFPEHDGHVHQGESYRDNLYRFYRCRLEAAEMPNIHRYVESGIARHRVQSRPFVFTHRNRTLQVSSLPIPGGRARVWAELPQESGETNLPRAHDLFANLADGALVLDKLDRIAAVNQEFLSLYEIASENEAIGITFAELLRRLWRKAEGAERTQAEAWLPLDDSRFAGAAFEVELPGRRWRRVIERRMPDGSAYMSHTDITVLKQQQRDLADATRRAQDGEERFRILTENSGDIIVSLDAESRLLFTSPAITRVLGWSPDELDGAELASLLHPEDRTRFRRTMADGQDGHGFESEPAVSSCRLRRRAGGWTWMEAHIRPVRSPTPSVRTICSFRDVTHRVVAEAALRDAHQRLARLVLTDPLTGIANRRRFEEVILLYGPGASDPVPVSLLMIDVDHFKRVNDRFGHQAGDACLMMVARLVQQLTGDRGLVARIGGEEFAVVLPGVSRPESHALAERIAEAVRSERSARYNRSIPVTVSIGVASAIAGDACSGMDAMVSAADAAMYRAKRNGRNQVALD